MDRIASNQILSLPDFNIDCIEDLPSRAFQALAESPFSALYLKEDPHTERVLIFSLVDNLECRTFDNVDLSKLQTVPHVVGSQFSDNIPHKALANVWGELPQRLFCPVLAEILIDSETMKAELKFYADPIPTSLRSLLIDLAQSHSSQESAKTSTAFTAIESASLIDFDESSTTATITNLISAIQEGKLEKVVASTYVKTKVNSLSAPLSKALQAIKKVPGAHPFMIAFGETKKHYFFGATPEHLLVYENGVVTTPAIAGTLRVDQAVEQTRSTILQDPKLRREQELVTSFIENAFIDAGLEPTMGPLTTIKNGELMHLYREVQTKTKDSKKVLNLIERLHPTPAMAGVPKKEATLLITNLETYNRGLYASPIGYFDPQSNSCRLVVGIRSALLSGSELYFFAGAGILAESDAALETQEIKNKAQVLGKYFHVC